MKDFDTDRTWDSIPEAEREFILRGERLVIRERFRPDAVARATSLDGAIPLHEELAVLDEGIREMLEPGFVEAWARVRANTEDPVQIPEMWQIISWAFSAVTGYPTRASSSSEPGRASTDGRSLDGSSLPAATPAA